LVKQGPVQADNKLLPPIHAKDSRLTLHAVSGYFWNFRPD